MKYSLPEGIQVILTWYTVYSKKWNDTDTHYCLPKGMNIYLKIWSTDIKYSLSEGMNIYLKVWR